MPPSVAPCPPAHDDPRIDIILTIIARETGVPREQLELGATPEEMGIASLDLMLAVFEIETHFQVDLPPPEAVADRSASTLGALLERALAAVDHAAAAQPMCMVQT